MKQDVFDDDVVADNPWYAVVERRTASGGKYTFLHFHHEGVRIVLVNGRGHVLLVRQFREPLQRELWEVPAGGVELGESPLEAAQRELLEEAGLAAESWSPIGKTAGMVNVADFEASLFLALSPVAGGTLPRTSATEETTASRFFSRAEVDKLIASGEIRDDKTLAALYLAERAGAVLR